MSNGMGKITAASESRTYSPAAGAPLKKEAPGTPIRGGGSSHGSKWQSSSKKDDVDVIKSLELQARALELDLSSIGVTVSPSSASSATNGSAEPPSTKLLASAETMVSLARGLTETEDRRDIGRKFLAKALKLQGCVAVTQDLLEEAAAAFEECADLCHALLGESHPAVADLLVNLSRVRSKQERHVDAAQALDRAGAVLRAVFGAEDPRVRQLEFQRAIEERKFAQAHYLSCYDAGMRLRHSGHQNEAASLFLRCLSVHPGDSQATLMAASCLAAVGADAAAVEKLRLALHSDPSLAAIAPSDEYLGRLLRRSKDARAALVSFNPQSSAPHPHPLPGGWGNATAYLAPGVVEARAAAEHSTTGEEDMSVAQRPEETRHPKHDPSLVTKAGTLLLPAPPSPLVAASPSPVAAFPAPLLPTTGAALPSSSSAESCASPMGSIASRTSFARRGSSTDIPGVPASPFVRPNTPLYAAEDTTLSAKERHDLSQSVESSSRSAVALQVTRRNQPSFLRVPDHGPSEGGKPPTPFETVMRESPSGESVEEDVVGLLRGSSDAEDERSSVTCVQGWPISCLVPTDVIASPSDRPPRVGGSLPPSSMALRPISTTQEPRRSQQPPGTPTRIPIPLQNMKNVISSPSAQSPHFAAFDEAMRPPQSIAVSTDRTFIPTANPWKVSLVSERAEKRSRSPLSIGEDESTPKKTRLSPTDETVSPSSLKLSSSSSSPSSDKSQRPRSLSAGALLTVPDGVALPAPFVSHAGSTPDSTILSLQRELVAQKEHCQSLAHQLKAQVGANLQLNLQLQLQLGLQAQLEMHLKASAIAQQLRTQVATSGPVTPAQLESIDPWLLPLVAQHLFSSPPQATALPVTSEPVMATERLSPVPEAPTDPLSQLAAAAEALHERRMRDAEQRL
jgi:tetratricopeptide (TPR) repeat protein